MAIGDYESEAGDRVPIVMSVGNVVDAALGPRVAPRDTTRSQPYAPHDSVLHTLTVNQAGTTTYGGVLSGAGGLTKAGAGTLTLSGNNAYAGATSINAGTLTLGNSNRIADASAVTVAAGATFNLAGFNETIGSLAGAGTVTKTGTGTTTLTVGADDTATVFSGGIQNPTGTLNLTKTGAGTLTLSGANTYTGLTTISGGTLTAAGGSAIADTSQVTLANTAMAP